MLILVPPPRPSNGVRHILNAEGWTQAHAERTGPRPVHIWAAHAAQAEHDVRHPIAFMSPREHGLIPNSYCGQ